LPGAGLTIGLAAEKPAKLRGGELAGLGLEIGRERRRTPTATARFRLRNSKRGMPTA